MYNTRTSSLLCSVHKPKNTPESFAKDLQLSLARLVKTKMDETGLTIGMLSAKSGASEDYVKKVLNGKVNCHVLTMGRLLHALGTRGRIDAKEATKSETSGIDDRTQTSDVGGPMPPDLQSLC